MLGKHFPDSSSFNHVSRKIGNSPVFGQMARYTEKVSPVTDLALVYGTSGFQMGFGFVTVPMPQVSNQS